uniref:SAM-dependent methyltransferase n=1 Tax=Mogibacterium pumilum TaxID=86332 RepID=A0A223ASV4_9FIRM|nr:class I SAM-dependent methyltransferase [Mogibacterium pumilum]ASS38047.1 hypothetical protein AXF17_06165 [Mogibacterium pumilum]
MKISDRIKVICDAVTPGETIADIGTDHAYVPLILYKRNISPDVIMCDISADSLSKARESFTAAEITMPESSFRIGDGLDVIDKGEVDALIIAGLGGVTIVDILSNDIDKLQSFKKLILQPRNNSGPLRSFLYRYGFDITDNKLVKEGKFSCEVIVAVKTSNINSENSSSYVRELPYEDTDIRWRYPEGIINNDVSVVRKRLGHAIDNHIKEIENLRRASNNQSYRIKMLEAELNYLKDLFGEIDG